MGKPEGTIEDYLVTQAEKNGFMCPKFVSPGLNGVPDRILIGYGHTLFIEVKRPNGKPRKLQEKVIERLRNHGAKVFVIDTKQDVDELLTTLIR